MADNNQIDLNSSAAGYRGYDHITWYVSNAKQAASYFITRMGFKNLAHRGLETGTKSVTSVVISNNAVKFVFTSALRPSGVLDKSMSEADKELVQKIHEHVAKHGDAVSDVAFKVDNVGAVYETIIRNGAGSVKPPALAQDKSGQVTLAVIEAFGDTTHTLVERSQYRGVFLPGYAPMEAKDPVNDYLPKIDLDYEQCLGFSRYWSVDDRDMCTKFSAMNSIVVTKGAIKMPLNEPAFGRKKPQIEEFIKYNGGPGVQHIAFHTHGIVDCVILLKRRGVQFIDVPETYYREMRERLNKVEEDLAMLERLSILIDFDDQGYLLQLFSKPLTDRPTIFIETIQRHHFGGFGAGNFNALFEAIEREQAKRGEL